MQIIENHDYHQNFWQYIKLYSQNLLFKLSTNIMAQKRSKHTLKNAVRFSYIGFMRLVNRMILRPLDHFLSPPSTQILKYPPIFIVGAPRSGSTLLIQVLIQAYNFGYLSNIHSYFYGSPALAEKLYHQFRNETRSDFSSNHGKVKGSSSPSEAGEYWYNFFRREPAYSPLTEVDPNKMLAFRRSISSIINVFNRVVLFKNLNASLRIRPIVEYIPEALFIHITRDVLDNAHSLLEARYKINGEYDSWWTVAPPRVDELFGLPPEEQVVEQVNQINHLIKNDFDESGIDQNKIFSINYDLFCSDVNSTLDNFEKFLKRNGVVIKRRCEVPNSFPCQRKNNIDATLYNNVKKYIAKIKSHDIK